MLFLYKSLIIVIILKIAEKDCLRFPFVCTDFLKNMIFTLFKIC